MNHKVLSHMLLAAALAFQLSWPAAAHADDTLEWRWQVLPAADAGEADVVLSASIKPGWIVYASDFQAPDLGPRPARLTIDASPGYQAQGEVRAVGSLQGKGSNVAGEYRYTYFSGQAEFRQRLRLEQNASHVSGTISGQTCFEETGLCTLFRERFEVALK